MDASATAYTLSKSQLHDTMCKFTDPVHPMMGDIMYHKEPGALILHDLPVEKGCFSHQHENQLSSWDDLTAFASTAGRLLGKVQHVTVWLGKGAAATNLPSKARLSRALSSLRAATKPSCTLQVVLLSETANFHGQALCKFNAWLTYCAASAGCEVLSLDGAAYLAEGDNDKAKEFAKAQRSPSQSTIEAVLAQQIYTLGVLNQRRITLSQRLRPVVNTTQAPSTTPSPPSSAESTTTARRVVTTPAITVTLPVSAAPLPTAGAPEQLDRSRKRVRSRTPRKRQDNSEPATSADQLQVPLETRRKSASPAQRHHNKSGKKKAPSKPDYVSAITIANPLHPLHPRATTVTIRGQSDRAEPQSCLYGSIMWYLLHLDHAAGKVASTQAEKFITRITSFSASTNAPAWHSAVKLLTSSITSEHDLSWRAAVGTAYSNLHRQINSDPAVARAWQQFPTCGEVDYEGLAPRYVGRLITTIIRDINRLQHLPHVDDIARPLTDEEAAGNEAEQLTRRLISSSQSLLSSPPRKVMVLAEDSSSGGEAAQPLNASVTTIPDSTIPIIRTPDLVITSTD